MSYLWCFVQSLVATAVGVQKIVGIGVLDVRDGKSYDTLTATEVCSDFFIWYMK